MLAERVQKRSASSMKPKLWLIQSTSSSLKRETCTMHSAAAAANSIAKSRSLTASMLLRQGAAMPRALGPRFAIERIAGAGQRRGAERQAIRARPHLVHALGVAREHLDVGQQV